ncbi:hypothetical protein N6H14_07520 [Paenibacillus sp. CC-CFT747]|nr:hypothetical protein N6H14_07520 [Paenibacillus sp. CC-CFT747]
MIGYIKEGWKEAARQPFLLVLLFVYRLVWGIVLYRMVQSVVVPLMHRYAGGISKSQVQLFLAEGEFQLTKTDLSHSYLWMLLAVMLARMFVTPLLNAGVYYSLSHPHLNMGYRFFKGIRELGRSFFLLYLVQMLLTAAPAYFLLPG